MALRVVIVGPGRVGSAMGRQLAASGVDLLGFIGRADHDGAVRAAAAVEFAGTGEVLAPVDHLRAHVVMFAVGDSELESAIAGLLAAAPPRPCSLWLHTSGSHGLEMFAAIAANHGIRRGALHPVAPFADAESGFRHMAGQPAVLLGDQNSLRLLERIARRLGMVAMQAQDQQRELYHAACVLAANGLVGLRGLVDDVLAAAGGLADSDCERLAAALMTSALQSVAESGAAAALSGPVMRGDAATVASHLGELSRQVPHATAAYRALMHAALRLAQVRGLPRASVDALRTSLAEEATEP